MFKKVGDGFLLDALCADVYAYSFYFRNQVAPKSWIDKIRSPIHARVTSLLQQLHFDANNFLCVMDNLYISPKFATVALNGSGKILIIHGFLGPNRGIPKCIVKEAVTKKGYIIRAKNKVKSARPIGGSKCEYHIEISFYNSKPVYFISNSCKKVEWIKKNRKLWHREKWKNSNALFFRLSLVSILPGFRN